MGVARGHEAIMKQEVVVTPLACKPNQGEPAARWWLAGAAGSERRRQRWHGRQQVGAPWVRQRTLVTMCRWAVYLSRASCGLTVGQQQLLPSGHIPGSSHLHGPFALGPCRRLQVPPAAASPFEWVRRARWHGSCLAGNTGMSKRCGAWQHGLGAAASQAAQRHKACVYARPALSVPQQAASRVAPDVLKGLHGRAALSRADSRWARDIVACSAQQGAAPPLVWPASGCGAPPAATGPQRTGAAAAQAPAGSSHIAGTSACLRG